MNCHFVFVFRSGCFAISCFALFAPSYDSGIHVIFRCRQNQLCISHCAGNSVWNFLSFFSFSRNAICTFLRFPELKTCALKCIKCFPPTSVSYSISISIYIYIMVCDIILWLIYLNFPKEFYTAYCVQFSCVFVNLFSVIYNQEFCGIIT